MGVFGKLLPDIKGRLVAFILEYLGQYFDGLNRQQVKLKLWEGDLAIAGVTLRPDAVNGILEGTCGLPWTLLHGSVGSLTLRVPWTTLRSEPVVVTVDGVHGVLMPKRARPYDADADCRREHEQKMARLSRWEAGSLGDSDSRSRGGWMGRLKSVVLENLRIQVRDVRFRFEDCVTAPHDPFAVCVGVGSLSCVTTSPDWQETFVSAPHDRYAFKMVSLNNLSAHVLPHIPLADCLSNPAGIAELSTGARVTLPTPPDGDAVLEPLSGKARLRVQRADSRGGPLLTEPWGRAELELTELRLQLTRLQYERLALVGSQTGKAQKRLDGLRKLRPAPFCRPTLGRDPAAAARLRELGMTADVRAWWRYAAVAVCRLSRGSRTLPGAPRSPKSAPAPRARAEDRERYVNLHAKKLAGADALTEAEHANYEMLQHWLGLEDLIVGRQLAHAAVRLQQHGPGAQTPTHSPLHRDVRGTPTSEPASDPGRSRTYFPVFGTMFRRGGNPLGAPLAGTPTSMSAESPRTPELRDSEAAKRRGSSIVSLSPYGSESRLEVNPEHLESMYAAAGELLEAPARSTYPDSAVVWDLSFSMPGGLVRLRHLRGLGDGEPGQSEHGDHADFCFRGLNVGFRAYPKGTTVDLRLTTLEVGVKSTTRQSLFPRLVSSVPQAPGSRRPGAELLHFVVDQQHRSTGVEWRVHSVLAPLQVVWDPRAVAALSAFCQPPRFADLTLLRQLGGTALEFARQELQQALESRAPLGIELDMRAPNLIFVEDVCCSQSPLLLVAMGHLQTYSVRKPPLDGRAAAALGRGAMQSYDSYGFSFEGAHARVSTAAEYLSRGASAGSILLRPLSAKGVAGRCMSASPSLPKAFVECLCGDLTGRISLAECQTLSRIIAAAVPAAPMPETLTPSATFASDLGTRSATSHSPASLQDDAFPLPTAATAQAAELREGARVFVDVPNLVYQLEAQECPFELRVTGGDVEVRLAPAETKVHVQTRQLQAVAIGPGAARLPPHHRCFIDSPGETAGRDGASRHGPAARADASRPPIRVVAVIRDKPGIDGSPCDVSFDCDFLDVAVGQALAVAAEFIWDATHCISSVLDDGPTAESPTVEPGEGPVEALVTAKVRGARVWILDDKVDHILIDGEFARLLITLREVGATVEGFLGNAGLKMLRQPAATQRVLHFTDVDTMRRGSTGSAGPRAPDPVHFSFTTPGPRGPPGIPQRSGVLTMEVQRPRLVFFTPQFMSLLDFLDVGHLDRLAKLPDRGKVLPASPAAGVRFQSPPRINIVLNHPVVMLPPCEDVAEGLWADLGTLQVRNAFERDRAGVWWDEVSLSFGDVHVRPPPSGDPFAAPRRLLQECQLRVLIASRAGLRDAGMRIQVRAPKLAILLNQSEYLLLLRVFGDNLTGTPPSPGLSEPEPKEVDVGVDELVINVEPVPGQRSLEVAAVGFRAVVGLDQSAEGAKAVEVGLRSLSLRDMISQHDLLLCRAAETAAAEPEQGGSTDFFSVQVTIPPDADLSTATKAEVSIGSLHFAVLPQPWFELQDFIFNADAAIAAASFFGKERVAVDVVDTDADAIDVLDPPPTRPERAAHVRIGCAGVSVLLLDRHGEADLLSAAAGGLRVTVSDVDGVRDVEVVLAELSADDCSDRRRVVATPAGAASSDFITVKHRKGRPLRDDGPPIPAGALARGVRLKSDIEITVSRVDAVYRHVLWREVAHSLIEGPLDQILLLGLSRLERAESAADRAAVSRVAFRWESPRVELPCDSVHPHRLVATMASLQVATSLIAVHSPAAPMQCTVCDQFSVGFRELKLTADTSAAASSTLFSGVDGSVSVTKTLQLDRQTDAPDVQITAELPPVRARLSAVDVAIIRDVASLNFGAGGNAGSTAGTPLSEAGPLTPPSRRPAPSPQRSPGAGTRRPPVRLPLGTPLEVLSDLLTSPSQLSELPSFAPPAARTHSGRLSGTLSVRLLCPSLEMMILPRGRAEEERMMQLAAGGIGVTLKENRGRTVARVAAGSVLLRDLSPAAAPRFQSIVAPRPLAGSGDTDILSADLQSDQVGLQCTIRLAPLAVALTPPRILDLARFVCHPSLCESAPQPAQQPRQRQVEPPAPVTAVRMEIGVALDGVEVAVPCSFGAEPLAEVRLARSAATMVSEPSGRLQVNGSLGNVQLVDCRLGDEVEILGLACQSEGSLITVTYSSSASPAVGYPHALEVTVHSVRVVAVAEFLRLLHAVVRDDAVRTASELFGVEHRTARLQAEAQRAMAASAARLLKVAVRVEHPIIAVPERPGAEESDTLTVDLGLITFDNSLAGGGEQFVAEIKDGRITCGASLLAEPFQLVGRGTRTLTAPFLADVRLDLSPVQLTVTEAQWMRILTILSLNLGVFETRRRISVATEAPHVAPRPRNPLAAPVATKLKVVLSCTRVSVHAEADGGSAAVAADCAAEGLYAAWSRGSDLQEEAEVSVQSVLASGSLDGDSQTTELLFVDRELGSAPRISVSMRQSAADEDSIRNIDVHFVGPTVVVVPEILVRLRNRFVTPVVRLSVTGGRGDPHRCIVIDDDTCLDGDLLLGPVCSLRVRPGGFNTVTLNGRGQRIVVSEGIGSVISVDDGVMLCVKNCTFCLPADSSIEEFVTLDGPGAAFLADPDCNHWDRVPSNSLRRTGSAAVPAGADAGEGSVVMLSVHSSIALRLLDTIVDEAGVRQSFRLRVTSEIEASQRVDSGGIPQRHNGCASFKRIEVMREGRASSRVVEPAKLDVHFRRGSVTETTGLNVVSGEVCARLRHGDVVLLTRVLSALQTGGTGTTARRRRNVGGSPFELDVRIEPTATLSLIDDAAGEVSIPLAEIRVKDPCVWARRDDDVGIAVNAAGIVLMNHYNREECEWEPVVEQVRVEAAVTSAESGSTVSLRAGKVGFTVSPAGLRTAKRAGALLRALDQPSTAAESFQRCPCRLVNTLPAAVQCSTHGAFAISDRSELLTLQPLQTAPLTLASATSLALVPPFAAATREAVVIDTSVLGLQPLGQDRLCADIRLENGVKVVSLCTDVSVRNHLHCPVLVSAGTARLAVLPPGDSVSVPKHALDSRLIVLPQEDASEWEEARPALPVSEHVHACRGDRKDASVVSERCLVSVSKRSERRFFIVLRVSCATSSAACKRRRVELQLRAPWVVRNLCGNELLLSLRSTAPPQQTVERHRSGDSGLASGLLPLANAGPGVDTTGTAVLAAGQALQLTGMDPGVAMHIAAALPGHEFGPSKACARPQAAGSAAGTDLQLGCGAQRAPVWLQVMYPPSGREVQLTCPYWIVNHTDVDLSIILDGVSTAVPRRSPKPVLFSPHGESGSSATSGSNAPSVRLALATGKGESHPLPLHLLGAAGMVELADPSAPEGQRRIAVVYSTSFASGEQQEGYRTRVLDLAPRWVVVNRTEHDLTLFTRWHEVPLRPCEPARYCCVSDRLQSKDSRAPVAVAARGDTRRSATFSVDSLGETVLKVPGVGLLLASVAQRDGITYACLTAAEPPFVIANRTEAVVRVWQEGFADQVMEVRPRVSASFGWEDSQGRRLRLVFEVAGRLSAPVDVGSLDDAAHDLEAQKEGEPALCCYELRPTSSATTLEFALLSDAALPHKIVRGWTDAPPPSFTLAVDMDSFGISILRQGSACEVANVTIGLSEDSRKSVGDSIGLSLRMRRSESQEELSLQVLEVQIDDMSEAQPLFPVVYAPASEPVAGRPFLRLSSRRRLQSSRLLHFNNFTLWLDVGQLNIGDHFLWSLFEFRREVVSVTGGSSHAAHSHTDAFLAAHCPSPGGLAGRGVHFDRLEIGTLCLVVTVDRLRARKSDDPFRHGLGLGNLAALLPSVKDCDILLPGLAFEDARDTVGMFADRLVANYSERVQESAIRNFVGVLGRVQALGSPGALFANITRGVTDFFVLPAVGLTQSPAQFGKGVLQGTGSLLGKSVGGVLGTVTGVTRGAARAFDAIADKDWRDRVSADSKADTKLWLHEAAAKGVFDGVTGLVAQPWRGAQRDGAVGGLVGVGRGIVGIVAKPVSGVLTGLSNTTERVEEWALQKRHPKRTRSPRRFGAEGQVVPLAGVCWKEAWENQRWWPASGWLPRMLPGERPPWSDAAGNHNRPRESVVPDPGYVWTEQWLVDESLSPREGWCYAVDFTHPMHPHQHELDFVRRRRWLRQARLLCDQPPQPPPTPPRPRFNPLAAIVPPTPPAAVGDAAAKGSTLQPRQTATESPSPRRQATGSPGPPTHVDLWESARWGAGQGGGWDAALAATDHWRWAGRSGRPLQSKAQTQPPAGTVWAGPWYTVGGDDAGWRYSDDFDGTWSDVLRSGDVVRRRHWRRALEATAATAGARR
eukprot:TRINITY_DN24798_c1_g1_i2.p1 TRINITY_DN24798_c1_g1~~TRINITY_DN24798_c1_g1_i2.p1  ORF type:complete len:4341 (+),score=992.28 TRINITY_DN24798_c1_g1_i2:62-13084(+)